VSTLHLTDSATAVGAAGCARAPPDADRPDVIAVSFAGSASRWLDDWQATVGEPRRLTVVTSDAAAWLAGDPHDRLDAIADGADVRVELVDSPRNFTDLGVTLTELLESYGERDWPTALCFRSLTVLLQYADSEDVYQFLHTLVGHLDRFDVAGHFHLHVDAHDEDVIATLEPLFDRVVRDSS